ncbi:acyl-CoA thioesterase [Alicyclobacillus vulcanalis]|uniref:Acyl-CoA thioester hydrolase n=1 Tax=Alicyclobacillus vulcanalis TaxID=252246 RepID=A0A1N7MBJ0_9BACL|nr:thioesterase family protein [Alicyclobacillus vulcanalis]SIS83417.1 acyl-CoA thioester hydrolase [Alicyclobacillus vulcanalis]
MIHETPIHIRYSDTDLNGHVNNAVYATYMEEARIAFLQEVFPGQRLPLVAASIHLDFRRETRYPEHTDVVVKSWLTRLGRSSFEFYHQITSVDGEVLCEGTAVVVHYDFETRKSAPLPDWARQALLPYVREREESNLRV